MAKKSLSQNFMGRVFHGAKVHGIDNHGIESVNRLKLLFSANVTFVNHSHVLIFVF